MLELSYSPPYLSCCSVIVTILVERDDLLPIRILYPAIWLFNDKMLKLHFINCKPFGIIAHTNWCIILLIDYIHLLVSTYALTPGLQELFHRLLTIHLTCGTLAKCCFDSIELDSCTCFVNGSISIESQMLSKANKRRHVICRKGHSKIRPVASFRYSVDHQNEC